MWVTLVLSNSSLKLISSGEARALSSLHGCCSAPKSGNDNSEHNAHLALWLSKDPILRADIVESLMLAKDVRATLSV